MADPTTLTEFADSGVSGLKAALAAAGAAITARRGEQTAADAALKAAAGELAKANARLGEVRRKLARIEMPADGEPLLAELRIAIEGQRDKEAALAAADLEQARAAVRGARAQSLLSDLAARLAAAEAAAKAAGDARKRRDAAIAAIAAPPLKDINQAATTALASIDYGKAKTRIEGALPDPLRKQSLARSGQAQAAAGRAEARLAAARAAADAVLEESNLATATLPRLKRLVARAEADLLGYTGGAPRRLSAAIATLRGLAGLNTPPLTPEQKTSLSTSADRDAAAQAEEKWDAAAVKAAEAGTGLEIERLKLLAADPDADLAAAEADGTSDAGKARKKWDDARTDLLTEDGNFTPAMRAAMGDWRAAVPDSLWLEAEAFLAADLDLRTLAAVSAAPLVTALRAAEAGLLTALLADRTRRRRLDQVESRLAAEAAFTAAVQSRADRLRSLAFRGHVTLDV